jgi:ATP-dependent DNA helicase RecG
MSNLFLTKIEFLKGVGPVRAEMLQKELGIFTYLDLLQHYPFRHEDRSKLYPIATLHEELPYVQIKAHIRNIQLIGEGSKKRLIAQAYDESGQIELVWFQGIKWVQKLVNPSIPYLIFGKPNVFGRKISLAHPELEPFTETSVRKELQPVYNTTEKLKVRGLDSKALSKLTQQLVEICYNEIEENLPATFMESFKLMPKREAVKNIHYPSNANDLEKAKSRLKFEELFLLQYKLLRTKNIRKVQSHGFVLKQIPTFNLFYKNHLPFELTDAQKKVIKEIYQDVCSGKQMNRLLQGDVGSGKTIVGFLTMLMALDFPLQACIMAPTEILAEQHYKGLLDLAERINIPIALLTGSTKKKHRTEILTALESGELKILIGTHALLEPEVKFKKLGMCIIDEQHRFGVAQRARLWAKNPDTPPHILVMTATPIPRTLAMTLYGDLDVSVIDQLPSGRKPIDTRHAYDNKRGDVYQFIKKQLALGRQIYFVFPLIEENEKLELKNLTDGFENIKKVFSEVEVVMIHGKLKADEKEKQMQRFVNNEAKIMVATTVIEVGVNVPNASVMVIENAERFGLSQLHQLRGRVGRGSDQSYCILMTGHKLSHDGKVRIETMVRTTNGFEIADVDLQLRGPGDLAGTQQSGVLDLKISNLAQDAKILQASRQAALQVLEQDPNLQDPGNLPLRKYLTYKYKDQPNWSKIS